MSGGLAIRQRLGHPAHLRIGLYRPVPVPQQVTGPGKKRDPDQLPHGRSKCRRFSPRCVDLKDAEYNPQLDRIHALQDKWIAPLGLGWWRRITWEYSDVPKVGSPDCVADATVSWQYQEATIRFYVLNVAGLSDDDLEYTFVHECMHVLVNEMRWTDEKPEDHHNILHEERVCTTLARAFIWVRDFAKRGEL